MRQIDDGSAHSAFTWNFILATGEVCPLAKYQRQRTSIVLSSENNEKSLDKNCFHKMYIWSVSCQEWCCPFIENSYFKGLMLSFDSKFMCSFLINDYILWKRISSFLMLSFDREFLIEKLDAARRKFAAAAFKSSHSSQSNQNLALI